MKLCKNLGITSFNKFSRLGYYFYVQAIGCIFYLTSQLNKATIIANVSKDRDAKPRV
ncbi:hypothetical protein HMPREF0083_02070 [Aneurinibacillus aneurinilyticus ATCC 12856]|uniref:Uncharacterized protein n=1 Tax=Aneurinibacillus aneurinilyticus ATCC 12856 TaxID=649747 RepID=U1YCK2_ANEAE|nr:hypothetical protein HMPREF0083_02070 [Aneurinibacillus aneurinilyticus ATCC 12856]